MKVSRLILISFVFVFALMSSVLAYGTNNPVVFGHSAGEVDFTGFTGNVSTTGVFSASQVCIGNDCRTSWPTFSSTITNSTVYINNISSLNLTTLMSNNFIINGTIFLNGTLVVNGSSSGIIIYNNTVFQTISTNSTLVVNNSFVTNSTLVINNTFVTNNTVNVPNPIDLTNINGNVIASGDVRGSRLCIGGDCRTSWPTAGTSNGGPNLVFQVQKLIDDDTNYYIDINSGANIGGNWNLNGQLKANTICIGNDCRTSWPSSSGSSQVDVLHTTVGTVNSVSSKTVSTHGVAQWMITGGHRYCQSQGYETGMVVEYESDSPSANVDVSCFN